MRFVRSTALATERQNRPATIEPRPQATKIITKIPASV